MEVCPLVIASLQHHLSFFFKAGKIPTDLDVLQAQLHGAGTASTVRFLDSI